MNLDPAWIFVMLLSSGFGFVYFQYGRKNSRFPFIICGLALMFAAYFVDTPLKLSLISIALGAGPFVYQKILRR